MNTNDYGEAVTFNLESQFQLVQYFITGQDMSLTNDHISFDPKLDFDIVTIHLWTCQG